MTSPMSNHVSSSGTSRPPDYFFTARRKDLQDGKTYGITARLGAGWKVSNGGIAIRINPGVRIAWDDELFIALWPNVPYDRGERPREPESDGGGLPSTYTDDNGDPPFG